MSMSKLVTLRKMSEETISIRDALPIISDRNTDESEKPKNNAEAVTAGQRIAKLLAGGHIAPATSKSTASAIMTWRRMGTSSSMGQTFMFTIFQIMMMPVSQSSQAPVIKGQKSGWSIVPRMKPGLTTMRSARTT